VLKLLVLSIDNYELMKRPPSLTGLPADFRDILICDYQKLQGGNLSGLPPSLLVLPARAYIATSPH